MASLPPPIGLEGESDSRLKLILFQKELDVTAVNGFVFWRDVLQVWPLCLRRRPLPSLWDECQVMRHAACLEIAGSVQARYKAEEHRL